ncbi:right-handed parallel beta-helix repeat-containing protein [Hymenobacter convexus]|uniref:right-handed parallel beta-helix repeat-containing protein n=1 Tax=Hymenobacter sp. CA1UV-4 TaxID=3063782 RepID=UPI002713F5A3|nr:right-handed parallel beta-helix repeat-containing protein [Hymenobacter sp. CA1UV-4]MDO7850333.1 right-handed parallel beta-helix repeat-containing protein [Hymenobacter sp. CA1UV-4]
MQYRWRLALLLLLATFGRGVLAQTPTLEFAAGADNPTGNGTTTNNQTITFQNNLNNPSGTTFATYVPTTTAMFALSNQQFTTVPTTRVSTGTGVVFGANGTGAGGGIAAIDDELFPFMNDIGSSTDGNYTSASGVAGGIGVNVNRSVSLFMSAQALAFNANTNTRYRYADLTITFNQPVSNPVLHITGMGGSYDGGSNGVLGFAVDMDLLTTGVSLSRLSGSTEFIVTNANTRIRNNAGTISPTTGSGGASGSVVVNTTAPITTVSFRLYLINDGNGNRWHPSPGATNDNMHVGEKFLVGVSQLAPAAASLLTGYVFEDVNYGGGAGRSLAASGGVARPNARVELYNSGGTYLSATTTDANGQYAFSVTGAGSYTVRVVNNTVTSSRAGYTTALIPVQTYNGTTTAVGGVDPARYDAGNGSTTTGLAALSTANTVAESQAVVNITAGATVTGPDFGYNFDTVVNTRDVATVTGNNAQGTLRQFIINSNALTGSTLLAQAGFYTNAENLAATSTAAGRAGLALPAGRETSIFMIPAGQLTNGVAVINTAAVLPQITGANVAINGATQTYNIGNTNDRLLGVGGTVGTGATALSQLNGPEVQLKGSRAGTGLEFIAGATNATVRGFSIYGYAQQIGVAADVTNTLIEQNMIGTTATSFTDPGTGVRGTEQGIYLFNSDNGTVRNNLIGYNGGMGIWVYGSTNGANGNTITNNELRGNAQEVLVGTYPTEGLVFDGLELQGASTGNTVSNNLITETLGHGIDSYGNDGTGGNTVTGNTISNNGVGVASNRGVEGSGLRIFGSTNTTLITNNILSGNNGSGVLVEAAANLVTISQNSIFGNTRLGIDLLTTAEGNTTATTYNGATGANTNVSINDNGDGDTGGNGVLNFPVITAASVTSSGLLVQGYARPGSVIEFFTADGTANSVTANQGFGQGRTYLGSATEGSGADLDAGTGTYTNPVNGLNQGTDNTNRFSFIIPLATPPAVGSALTSTATVGNSTSEFSGNAAVVQALTGYVFEDVNYGGGAGRPRTATGAVGRPGAKVELYNSSGALVATAITDANGQYALNAPAGTGYTVRVVNSSVISSRTGATFTGSATAGYTSTQVAVQTYNGSTSAVGGVNPAFTDAAANTGSQTLAALTSGTATPESIATVSVAASGANTGPDFGFNFDVVVNTNDAGQGSLRQFIANASALGDENLLAQSGFRADATGAAVALPANKETSIFMIPGAAAVPGLRAGLASGLTNGPTTGVALITVGSTLTLTGANAANTIIDGGTQTFNLGTAAGNTAPGQVAGTGTAATTVGVDGNQSVAPLNIPEVEISGNNIATVLDVEGASITLRGFAIHGGNGTNNNTVLVGNTASATDYLFENLAVGVTAAGAQPGANLTSAGFGIGIRGNAGIGTVQNSLVAYTGNSGLHIDNGTTTVGTTQILNNQFLQNGYGSGGGDGITFGDGGGSGPALVRGNLFTAPSSSAIQFETASTSATTVDNNTITGAGAGGSALERGGIVYLRRAAGTPTATQADVISKNVITGSQAAGIVVGYGQQNVTISQNNTNGNVGLGIDLIANSAYYVGSGNAYGNGDGVTLNDGNDPTAASALPNRGLDFPIITSATIVGNNLVVKGYARPGVTAEFFIRDNDAGNFGEGQTYLGGGVENGAGDQNTATTTVTYSGTINGLNQGADNSNQARGFTFSLPIGSLTTGQLANLNTNGVTATATLSGIGTSEFAGRTLVNTAPVPNTVTNVNIPDNNGATVLNPNLSSSVSGTLSNGTANSIQYYTITSLPATGTLTYNGTVLTAANIAATQITPALLNTLTFTPVFGVPTTVSFTYTSTDGNGITSTTNSNGGAITAGPATYTIPVVDVADVTTVVTGPATMNAGQPTGTYIASFTNNGPNTAAGVTQKVTLPAGASLTSQQQTNLVGLYPGTSFSGNVIYFTGAPVSLASGATNSYSFVYTASNTAGTGTTLTSNVTTTTSQGTVTAAPDAFNLPITVNSVADVLATISGNGPKNTGALATFTATFTNNGPQAATSVVPTIQLPAGLTNVTITPPTGLSILYNSATGLVTFTATPTGGAVASLAAGAGNALTATISYTQPLGAVTATAAVSTTSNEAGLTANNQQSATINANTVFDVATTISGPTTATSGTQVAYNVTTSNNGPSAAPNVVQTVTLPAGATNVFVTGNATISGSTVTFPTIASLASGQTVNNTVSFTAPGANSNYSVVASVAPTTTGGDTDGTNNSRTASATVTAPPVATTFANAFVTVGVAATATPGTPVTSVDAGTSVTFTVTEGNNGRDAATGVVTRVAIPTNLPITGPNALKIGVNGGTPAAPTTTTSTQATYGSGATAITYDLNTGIVTSGSTATQATGSANYQTYALVFNAPTSGVVTATADVSTTTIDNVPANNLATAQVTVNPALTDVVTTIAGPAAATAGELLSYSVTTTNNGPAPANSVVQLANIPAGLPVTGANAVLINGAAPTSVTTVAGVTTATYGNATYNQNTGLVTFATITSQAAGATASNTIAYYAPANGNTNLTNTAEVSTSSPESNTTNNATVVATALTPTADVQVAILGPTSAVQGGGVTYTVVTTNNGPSVAGTVTTTVQLPTGLSNVVVRDVAGTALVNSTTAGYNAADGIVRFGVQTSQAAGSLDASIGTITFDVPANTNLIQPTAMAVVTGAVPDQVERNNTATIATTIKPATSTLIDMATSVSVTAPSNNPTSVAAGTSVTFSVNTRNSTVGTTATNVVQTLELTTGLPVTGANALLVNGAAPTSVNATTGVATYAGGATYDPATGLVTFSYATFPTGLQTNTVTLVAPGATPLVASAVVRADQSEPVNGNANNTAVRAQPVTLTPDVATAITGPGQTIAGAPVSYTVVTSAAGLSNVSGVTQTVKLPAGVTAYSLNGGALITVASGATITIPVPGTLNPGAANAVSNVITFAAPTATFDVTGFATATGDAGTTGNNTSTQTTTIINKAPVAAYVVNTLQAPESNSANTNQLAISPLSAIDPEGNAITYLVTQLPDAAQGVLYYNNGGTYTAVTINPTTPLTLTPTQAATLRFDPTPGFVGNAAFQYTATDALGAVSNTAIYLVPVGSDNAAVYTSTPTKGGNTNQYANGDVLAYGIDPNGALYNTAGLIYSNTGTAPATGTGAVSNGISFGKLSVADSTALALIGIRYTSSTGLFTVVNRTLLPRAGRSTTVSITTVDLFGGVTVQNFTVTTGNNPLPVELTDFTATAVKNVDAALVWHTATEKNNDHFEVERSLNGTDFAKIGQVKGQGNAATPTAYALTDAGIGRKAAGLVYYRLRQVDTDGTATYSPVRTVAFTATAAEPSISLFPNPATSTTQLDLTTLPAGTYQVSVLDATGRMVLSATREAGLSQALDVNTIASGTYTVLVRGQNNGQLINLTKRLIKE